MKLPVALSLALLTTLATAHKVTTVFPSGARPLTAEELSSVVEGRAFTAQPAEGPRWILTYAKGGEFSVRAGTFSDEGKWTTSESAVCTEGKRLKYLCNDLRVKDGKLFIQRKGGEVMQLVPRSRP